MLFDKGANCRAYWDKHLLYILFGRHTSVRVSGSSTFSATDVGLVPIMLPGSPTLHSLASAYWIPTYFTNTLLPKRSQVL